MKKIAANRKYKDSLFRLVFMEKKELLSLYNAVNASYYDNPEEQAVSIQICRFAVLYILQDYIRHILIKTDLIFTQASL